MKMKKWILFLSCILCMSMLFTGCGKKAVGSYIEEDSSAAYDNAETETAYEIPKESYTAAEEKETGDLTAAFPADVKIIFYADMTIETLDFDASSAAVRKKAADLGGYVEESQLDNYGHYRYLHITLRIPSENFRAFCDGAGELGSLRNFNERAENVTENYYDTESRLNSAKARMEALQELLKQAKKMEDIITIQDSIFDCQYEIDSLSGDLHHYDSLVGYSTITVSLQEVSRLSDTEEPAIGFGQELVQALKKGVTGFIDGVASLILFIARHIIGFLLFNSIVVSLVLLIRRRIRRRRMPKPNPDRS